LIAVIIAVVVILAITAIFWTGRLPDNVTGVGGERFTFIYRAEDGAILEQKGASDTDFLPEREVPVLPGKVFAGWDKDLTGAGEYLDTTAKYVDVRNDDHVVALPAVYGSKSAALKLPLKILGMVDLCGMDITLSYDTSLLDFAGHEQDDIGVTVDSDTEPGLIYVRFVSAANASGEIDLSVLSFKVKGEEKTDTDIRVFVKDTVRLDGENNIVPAPYNVLDGKLYIY
jgi:hypothetical protein